MIYENKFLPRLTSNKQSDSTYIIMEIAGLEMISYETYNTLNKVLLEESKNIFQNYLQCSDLLQFLSSATYHSTYFLKYKLNPPITTSRIDCEYILKSLARVGYMSDFSYSSQTKSFWIEINRQFSYTIKKILSIGISGLLEKKYEIKYNVELRDKTDNIWSDILITSENKLLLIHVELAAGLETDVSTHISQFNKLKAKIIRANRRSNIYLSEYILITPIVFQQLPKVLQQMNCIITIDNIESKIKESLTFKQFESHTDSDHPLSP